MAELLIPNQRAAKFVLSVSIVFAKLILYFRYNYLIFRLIDGASHI